jgi:hypothetical protein
MTSQYTDTPDWGGQYNNSQMYPLFDMGELAARLDSPVTYDRRGAVLWMYDFREGIGDVGPATSGTGSAVNLSVSIFERPPCSCVLQSGTDDGAYARLERRVPVPQGKRVGVAASLRCNPNVSKVYLDLYHYDGSSLWWSYLVADLDAGTLSVRTLEDGVHVLDASFPDLSTGYYFSHFKLVCDLSNHSLVRGIVDDAEYDLSAYTMPSQANGSAPNVLLRVTNEGHNLVAATVNVDSIIVTTNEP